jgi:hypothetical protein
MGVALWGGMIGIGDTLGPVFGLPGAPAGDKFLRVIALTILVGGGAMVFAATAFATGAAERADLQLLRRKRG